MAFEKISAASYTKSPLKVVFPNFLTHYAVISKVNAVNGPLRAWPATGSVAANSGVVYRTLTNIYCFFGNFFSCPLLATAPATPRSISRQATTRPSGASPGGTDQPPPPERPDRSRNRKNPNEQKNLTRPKNQKQY